MYIILFVTMGFLTPFLFFLYETDEDKSIFSRILSAFLYYIWIVIIIGVFIVIALTSMRYISLQGLAQDLVN